MLWKYQCDVKTRNPVLFEDCENFYGALSVKRGLIGSDSVGENARPSTKEGSHPLHCVDPPVGRCLIK